MVLGTQLGDPTFWIAAFAGGAFGAAIGALPAFIFTGFAVIAGEALTVAGGPAEGMGSITGYVGFGPIFGPHISFAAGAAAAAYAAKQGYIDDGKNILWAAGTHHTDVLLVGGGFGLLGLIGTNLFNYIGVPTDNIALMVFLSALIHRVAFGYSVIGEITGSGMFDVGPFERDEENAPGIWLPWQYKWGNVALIGVIGGILGGAIWQATGSGVLAFGLSAASLVFLQAGTDNIPVTHHITLPGTVGAVGAASGVASGSPALVLIFAALFGVFGAAMGEVCNRVFYMHGRTHVDPPAFGIAASGLLATVFVVVGLFGDAFWAYPDSILGVIGA
jgi:hypothetical protein